MFELNLVMADYYMSKPIHGFDLEYSEFRGYPIKEVPVIRLFGPTRKGHKVCLHVHGVFPYLYIPFDGGDPSGKEIYKIVTTLDRMLNAASGNVNSTFQHVYNVHLVTGIPFYGFHEKESQFLKVFFYNPSTIKKAVEILQSGAIANKIYQAYEAHIPFILQFMIDYKLHGMSYVSVAQVMFRRGSMVNVPEDQLLPEYIKKLSVCKIEGDVHACSIIAPIHSEECRSINPGLNSIWEEEKQRRRNGNKPSQMTPQVSQDRPESLETDSEIVYKMKLKEKLSVAFSQAFEEKDTKHAFPRNPYVYPEETPECAHLVQASHTVHHTDPALSACSGNVDDGSECAANSTNIFNNAIFVNLPSSDGASSDIGAISFEFNSQDIDLALLLDDLAGEKNFDDDSVLGSQNIGEENDEDVEEFLDESMMDKLNLGSENAAEIVIRQCSFNESSHKESNGKPKYDTDASRSDPAITMNGRKTVAVSSENENYNSSERGLKELDSCSCRDKEVQSGNGVELKINKGQVNICGIQRQMKLQSSTVKVALEDKPQRDFVRKKTTPPYCTLCNTQNSYCRTRRKKQVETSEFDYRIKENVKVKQCSVQLERLHDSYVDFVPSITIERQASGSSKINYLESGIPQNSNKSEKNKHQNSQTCVLSLDGANDSSDSHDPHVIYDNRLYHPSTSTEQTVTTIKKKSRRRRHHNLKSLKETNDEDNTIVEESLIYEKNETGSHLAESEVRSTSYDVSSNIPDVLVGDRAGGKREENSSVPIKPTRKKSGTKHSPVRTQKKSSYKSLNVMLQKSPKKDIATANSEIGQEETKEFLVHTEDKHPDETDHVFEVDEESLEAAESLLQFKYGLQQSDSEVSTPDPAIGHYEQPSSVTRGSFCGAQDGTQQKTSDLPMTCEEQEDRTSVYSWKISIADETAGSLASENLPDFLSTNSGIDSFYESCLSDSNGNLDSDDDDESLDSAGAYRCRLKRRKYEEIGKGAYDTAQADVAKEINNFSGKKNNFNSKEKPIKFDKCTDLKSSSHKEACSHEHEVEYEKTPTYVFRTPSNSNVKSWNSRKKLRRKLYSSPDNQQITDLVCSQTNNVRIHTHSDILKSTKCEGFPRGMNYYDKSYFPSSCEHKRVSCVGSSLSYSSLQSSPRAESPQLDKTCIDVNFDNTMSPAELSVTQLLDYSTKRRKFLVKKNDETEFCREKQQESPIPSKMLLETLSVQQSPTISHSVTKSGGQIVGVTPRSSCVFEMTNANLQDVRAISQCDNLTLMALEVHITTRGDLRPDPTHDAIEAVFYTILYSSHDTNSEENGQLQNQGIIAVTKCTDDTENETFRDHLLNSAALSCSANIVPNERMLLQELVNLVRTWDPDILTGYEVEMLSWGYIFKRAFTLEMNLCPEVSRIPTAVKESKFKHWDTQVDMGEVSSEMKLVGRIILNIWRLLRHEVSVMSYSFENMMFHILHQRVPYHKFKDLTIWWNHRNHNYRWMTVEHYLTRVCGIIKMLDQLDIIGRTCELARLFGIQFYEVLSRGSQFRVESMMLRLAKPCNYVPISPSIQQRARMRAPECLPLIMEPMSRFYTDPVIVLDFQSLYPSMMIAYNYCFSTCLGRVDELGQTEPFTFGCAHLRVSPQLLKTLENDIHVSPCGVAFVKEHVRKGILPRMLEEILETRLMVKKSMKDNSTNRLLQRVLHSRQLGLKLIANVTYGYTSANFSGRMPCVEVGDSVVSKGRETLERAIKLVESKENWDAKVVYGDTDSLFVLVKGRSRQEAFKIGSEIANAVTMDNPRPVKLKMEKVYQPCILQTKKRYVGYMYETPDQEVPVYDAKGIETVRRDGCPIVAKVLKQSLCTLFEHQDTNLVEQYVKRQFSKLLQGRFNLQDLTFAREYRGISGYRPGACVPALELVRSWLKIDKCAEPRVGERVPYVIVNGPPGLPLIRLVRSPYSLLTDPGEKVNVVYYITRVLIPPLDRCFSLLGIDVELWYQNMPRKHSVYLPLKMSDVNKKSTISQYFNTVSCAVCDTDTQTGLCLVCQKQPQISALVLSDKIRIWERNNYVVNQICQSCCGHKGTVSCMSLDCPVLFMRYRASRDQSQVPYARQLLEKNFDF